MSWIDGLAHRLRVLWRGDDYADEQRREIEFHLQLAARGGDETAPFGNVTVYREQARAASALRWLDRLRQDVTYTARTLRRNRGFTATVLLTLAMGFGVNAAMFSMFHALFLHMPDAVPAAKELRRVYFMTHGGDGMNVNRAYATFSYPQYRAIASATPEVPLAAVGDPDSVKLESDHVARVVWRSEISGNYFDILRLRPEIGRFFAPDEDRVESPAFVAVISDALWRRAFHADAAAIGRRITLDDRPFTIVGVAPREFTGIDLQPADVWVPLNTHVGHFMGAAGPWYTTFASSWRLVARPRSLADERTLLGRGTNAYRATKMQHFLTDTLATLTDASIVSAAGPVKPADEIIVATRVAGMSVVVLLIACANVINLLLLRASRRKREIAVRRALGVSHRRLIEQITIESVMLSLLGGAVGLVFAQWAGTALRRLMMPRAHWSLPVLDGPTVAFILGVSLVVGIAAGLAPALHGLKPNLVDALRAGSRDTAYRASRFRGALLVIQTALCVVLLVGAGLFLRSLSNVSSIGVGYDADRLALVSPEFADGPFAHAAELRRAAPIVAEELRHVRGVEGVAIAGVTPMSGVMFTHVSVPGRDSLPRVGSMQSPAGNAVSPNFFAVSGVRMLRGRAFSAADGAGAPPVVIVNATMARVVWPGEDAIGKCLIIGDSKAPCSTVVGVSEDSHVRDIIEAQSMQYFQPIAQTQAYPTSTIVRMRGGSMEELRAAASRAYMNEVPVSRGATVQSMAHLLDVELRPWQLGATLFTAFGVLALVVAAIGVYSVVAYGVSQRVGEMGIRVALGARTSDILDLVVADGLRVVGVGIAVGLAAALLLGRLVSAFLFGVTARDPSAMIGAAVVLCAIGIAACLVPGWRAARVDPASALRAE